MELARLRAQLARVTMERDILKMELARLRAQLARVTMERDILKKATAYFARESL